MEKFHQTDCVEILSQIKHQEKLLNLKRRWLMGLPTSKSKKKKYKEPEFFKYKTLPESYLREGDVFCDTIKAHVEEAFGVCNSGRGNHVIQDSAQSFDASKITGVLFSCLDALTNDGLYLIAMILSGGLGKFEKTPCKMIKFIRESLPRCLSSGNHDHEQKKTIMQLHEVLNDPQNFQINTMKSMTPTFQIHHAAATQVLDGLDDLPFQTLIAMDRKLRCLKSMPQLKISEQGAKRKRLIMKVRKTARSMLMDPDEGGKLRDPLAKALAVADLSLKLTTGCQNTSSTSFVQFTPEIIRLQNDIVKAIRILKTKVRFPELKTLKLLLDPDVDISTRCLRGAITNMLMEFLFECSDMDTIPKCLLETISVINKDSRSLPHERFLKDGIEEEVECILSVSAELKQIVWDLLPDYEIDEEFADAYGEEFEGTDDDGCIEDEESRGNDGKAGNKDDLESCMSYSVNSIERDEVVQDMKFDPSRNEKSSKDINQAKSKGKLHASNYRNCFSSFKSPSGELNCHSIERDEVEQNLGVNTENASSTCKNRYLAIQEACDDTSLVAYNLIGQLLEKFAKEQDMDLDWRDSLYLRGGSSTQEHTQEEKPKSSEEDGGDDLIKTLKELIPFCSKKTAGT